MFLNQEKGIIMSKKDKGQKKTEMKDSEAVVDMEKEEQHAGEDMQGTRAEGDGSVKEVAGTDEPDKASGQRGGEDDELAKLKNEVGEMKEKYLRLYSEFENYRKRNARERIELISSANRDLIVELLPVLDDFERASEAVQNGGGDDHAVEGYKLIYKRLQNILKSQGLKEIEDGRGSDFDTEFHEAVAQFPVEDDKLKGKIYDVVEKGYFLNDKVIRFAKVVTGS
jgi:molecular chaperone GrpE